ncbi:MAG: carboxylate--amine ligase [Bacillota bacterium]
MSTPTVMLGANFYTALGAIRTLGRRGIPVYALDYYFPTAYALSSRYVTQKILCPNINQDENGLADFLIELGQTFPEKPVLMATADSYALLISRYADDLSQYYLFPENKPGLLEKIIDKKGLAQLAWKHNILIPRTFVVDQSSDLKVIAREINYPCIIKPALSHQFVRIFREKCLFVNNQERLLSTLKTARASGLEVMVQEIIPGFDDQMYVFDFYVNNENRVTHTLSAQKLRQFPINFGSSTLTHQCHQQGLINVGIDYIKRLGYRGYGEIEFKKHPENGDYYLIEINARLSTLNVLFDRCGQEFTYIMYQDLIGDPLPDYHLSDDRPWAFWHIYEDLISTTAYLRKKQLTVSQIIKPLFSHHKAHAIWASDDIKPLFSFIKLIIGKVFAKFLRATGLTKKK